MSQIMTHEFGGYKIIAPIDSRMDRLCRELRYEFPDLKMRHKRTVWYHWIAHVLICIFTVGLNRHYISAFTTTSKNTVDWSDKHHERLQGSDPIALDRVWETLMHELEHLRQFRDKGSFKMVIIWAIPPILFCYGRAIVIEKPGYIASLRAKYRVDPQWACSKEYREWWISCFTSASYGWMWVCKSQVARWFDEELERLERNLPDGS